MIDVERLDRDYGEEVLSAASIETSGCIFESIKRHNKFLGYSIGHRAFQ